jgi:hypothetical protein
MDDTTAIDWLRSYSSGCECAQCEAFKHAISAIETLAKVTDVVQRWHHYQIQPGLAMAELIKILDTKP